MKKYAYRFYDWGVHDFGKTDYPEQQKRLTFTTRAVDIQIWENGDSVGLTCQAATDAETTAEYGNASSIEWTFLLTEDSPYLDIAYKLHAKQETPLAESGHIVFPLKLERPQFSINKLGSVVNPLTDTIRSSSTLLHCCENFVDISNGFAGMAIIPLDSPLFLSGQMACGISNMTTSRRSQNCISIYSTIGGDEFPAMERRRLELSLSIGTACW